MSGVNTRLEDLKQGDIVRLSEAGPYMDATVKQVAEDGTVTFFRPYVTSSETVYGDGRIICHIGIEEFSTNRRDQQWMVLRKGDAR